MKTYLGVDVGSVSTNVVVLNEGNDILKSLYIRTKGQPIKAIQAGLAEVSRDLPGDLRIAGVGTTGSARHLAGVIVGADAIKNEITAHAVAASVIVPGAQTVIEIGGQDSKIIILRDGVVADFAMNSVCAAGTGSFLDQQAARLGIRIENFGPIALQSRVAVRIAGRCSVFAESDMIHKQQMGHRTEDILFGLCEALVRNYLNNVGKGKDIRPPVVFQGGVASNTGIKKAFEKALECEIIVPRHHDVMGAVGAAILAREQVARTGYTTFKGFEASALTYEASSFECGHCANLCEIIEIAVESKVVTRWGAKCPRWDNAGEERHTA